MCLWNCVYVCVCVCVSVLSIQFCETFLTLKWKIIVAPSSEWLMHIKQQQTDKMQSHKKTFSINTMESRKTVTHNTDVHTIWNNLIIIYTIKWFESAQIDRCCITIFCIIFTAELLICILLKYKHLLNTFDSHRWECTTIFLYFLCHQFSIVILDHHQIYATYKGIW